MPRRKLHLKDSYTMDSKLEGKPSRVKFFPFFDSHIAIEIMKWNGVSFSPGEPIFVEKHLFDAFVAHYEVDWK